MPRTTSRKVVEVYLTEEEKARLKAVALMQDMSQSEYGRLAIVEKMERSTLYKVLEEELKKD